MPIGRLIVVAASLVLLAAGPSPAAEIHQAVQAGDLAKVKALLDRDPAQVNVRDEGGRTPLHLAARGTSAAVLALLVERGADVNALDGNGIAPLHSLASRGNADGVRLLLDRGADINVRAPNQWTPLHHAAVGRQAGVLGLLVKRKADLESPDDRGRTPLILAAREMAGPEVVRTLLDLGARIDVADRYGDSALSLAAWRGSAEVVSLLLARGAALPTAGPKARQLLRPRGVEGVAGAVRPPGREGGGSGHSDGQRRHAARGGGGGWLGTDPRGAARTRTRGQPPRRKRLDIIALRRRHGAPGGDRAAAGEGRGRRRPHCHGTVAAQPRRGQRRRGDGGAPARQGRLAGASRVPGSHGRLPRPEATGPDGRGVRSGHRRGPVRAAQQRRLLAGRQGGPVGAYAAGEVEPVRDRSARSRPGSSTAAGATRGRPSSRARRSRTCRRSTPTARPCSTWRTARFPARRTPKGRTSGCGRRGRPGGATRGRWTPS